MASNVADPKLVAFCGLYCGACRKYQRGKCPGCAGNTGATWCKIRACCLENHYLTCADCTQYADVTECGKYNNFIAKLFGLIFRSNRKACIYRIKAIGVDQFAAEMAAKNTPSVRR